jgi:hypothetical protein
MIARGGQDGEEEAAQVHATGNPAPKRPHPLLPSDVRFGVKGENDPEPEIECRPWLELRGKLMEPIRDTFDVVFKLWPDPNKRVGPARPASVGYVMGVRPTVEVAADFAPAHFDYLWSSLSRGTLRTPLWCSRSRTTGRRRC